MKWLGMLFGRQSHSISDTTNSSSRSAALETGPRDYLPSPCFSTIIVSGPRLGLEEFRKSVSGFNPTIPSMRASDLSTFCLNSILPIDPEFFKLDRITIIQELRHKLWGCKSEAAGVTLKQSSHSLRYFFCTSEAPPLLVFDNLIKKNKNLGFEIECSNSATGLKMFIKSRYGRMYKWTTANAFEAEVKRVR